MRFFLLALIISFNAVATFSQDVFNRLYNKEDGYNESFNSVIQTKDKGFVLTGHSSRSPVISGPYHDWVYTIKTDAWGDTLWVHFYDHSAHAWDNGFHALEYTDGSIYIAGAFFDTVKSSSDGFLMKLDANGNFLWHKVIDAGHHDKLIYIMIDKDGTLVILGYYYSNTELDSSKSVLIKTDTSGNVLWQKEYGGDKYDFMYDIKPSLDRGYIMAGGTTSFGAGEYDLTIIKLDSNFNQQWQRTYGTQYSDKAGYKNNIKVMDDGGYIFAGGSNILPVFPNWYWNSRGYVVKTDSLGNIQWERFIDTGPVTDFFKSVQILPDGNYLLSGTTHGYSWMNSRPRGWLVKLSQTGTEIWSRMHTFYGDSTEDNYINDLLLADDGGFVMTGYIINNWYPSRNDGWLVKTDSCGYTVGAQPVAAFSMDSLIDKTVYLSNLSSDYCSFTWDFGEGSVSLQQNPVYTFSDTGTYTIMLIARAGDGLDTFAMQVTISVQVGISYIEQERYLKIFPNPASDVLYIQHYLNGWEINSVFYITNIIGKEIITLPLTSHSRNMEIRVNHLLPGSYFYHLTVNGIIKENGKMLIMR